MRKVVTSNQRVYALLNRYGYQSCPGEFFDHVRQRRRDFPYTPEGGFADILAWRRVQIRESLALEDNYDFRGVLAIQGCSEANLWSHYDKLVYGQLYKHVRDWLLAGNRLEIWAMPRPSRKSRLVGKNHQLNIKFIRFTYDQELLYEQSTELTALGYVIGGE